MSPRRRDHYSQIPPCSWRRLQTFLILSLVLFLCILETVEAGYHKPENVELRFCGKKLVQMLQKMCNHRFSRPSEDHIHSAYHTRSKRGIAHDCCKNRCTLAHIRTFCED